MSSPFSVLITVYDKETPKHLTLCLDSIYSQTLQAEEIVIVKDGPVSKELESVLDLYSTLLPIVIFELDRNQGQGIAANLGLSHCSFSLVARMDSDDICVHDRFEKQIRFLDENPDIDVIGASILEFTQTPEDGKKLRKIPAKHEQIKKFAKSRSPINNMTAVFRKDKAIYSGGYGHCRNFEDYYLWVRMLVSGCTFHNLEEVLVYARCGNGMQKRRGGLKYSIIEAGVFIDFYRLHFLTFYECIKNIVSRCLLRLLPSKMRGVIYQQWLRN